jgi:hypothetical protein
MSASQSPPIDSNAALAAELAAALELNKQMHVAGVKLQKENAELQQQAVAARSTAASSTSTSVPSTPQYGYPKGPTPPEFNGTKVGGPEIDAWVRDMRAQFTCYGAQRFPDDAAKVRHAALFLKGRAAEWWEAEDKSTGVEQSWDRFVERLYERYRPMLAAVVARERLRNLKQTGSVSSYADVFQRELAPIKDMSPSDQVFNFVSGLSLTAVANKVREKEPKTLHEAMDLAVRADLFLRPGGRFGQSGSSGHFRQGGGAPSGTPSSVPMDVNMFQKSWDDQDNDDPTHHDEEHEVPDSRLMSTLLSKMGEMVQHQVTAMMQQSTFKGKAPYTSNDRVPGLSASDIQKLRSEGRCFRCKQKGHNKSECPKGTGAGKPSFQ